MVPANASVTVTSRNAVPTISPTRIFMAPIRSALHTPTALCCCTAPHTHCPDSGRQKARRVPDSGPCVVAALSGGVRVERKVRRHSPCADLSGKCSSTRDCRPWVAVAPQSLLTLTGASGVRDRPCHPRRGARECAQRQRNLDVV